MLFASSVDLRTDCLYRLFYTEYSFRPRASSEYRSMDLDSGSSYLCVSYVSDLLLVILCISSVWTYISDFTRFYAASRSKLCWLSTPLRSSPETRSNSYCRYSSLLSSSMIKAFISLRYLAFKFSILLASVTGTGLLFGGFCLECVDSTL